MRERSIGESTGSNASDFSLEFALPAVADHFGFACDDSLRRASTDQIDRLTGATHFVDGQGSTRSVYRPLALRWVRRAHHLSSGEASDDDPATSSMIASVIGDATSVECLRRIARLQRPDGAFLADSNSAAPERRWYDELVILHALATCSGAADEGTIQVSIGRASRFHARETQPDHASNQPWALAAFLAEPEAIPLADMMLHAAGVQQPSTMDAASLLLLAEALDCSQRRATR